MRRKSILTRRLAERLRYEEGIAACSRSLIAGGSEAVNGALEHLRSAAGASRVYLFENFSDPDEGLCLRQICEACAPGVEPQITNPTLGHLSYRRYVRAGKLLAEGKPFWGLVKDLDPDMKDLLAPQRILSILNIPVNVAGAWYGFIGFDDTEKPRTWGDEDVRLLLTAAEMIGAYLTRERTTEELARGKAKMDNIFLTVPCGIGMVVDRVFTEVNERLCRITGYQAEELIGQNARMLYVEQGEYDRVGAEELERIAREGTGAIETQWRRKDGTTVDILLSSSPLVPNDLQGDFLFAVLDITERAAAERQRRLIESQVQHVQKLESLGVLAGGFAHDFNNLLMVVLGNLELASSEPSLPAAVRLSLRDMGVAARHGADLTKQLLAYAGRGRLLVQRIDLSVVIRDMCDIISASVAKNAEVRYELASDLPKVDTDASQIRQVVMNLLVNASESLGEIGGTITVRTGVEDLNAADLASRILGQASAPGTFAFLDVRDTGAGMDRETQERVFDPFFTTKFIGRGLGLPAVHGIVRSHRGCILVESEVGTGSLFRASFPVSPTQSLT
jgi:PAS domain S-box-containing protein